MKPVSQTPTTRPGTVDRSRIRVKALAVILHPAGDRHLCLRMRDTRGEVFHRPLGGGIELGETSAEAVVREIREELDATFVPDRLLGVVENIFELDGETGHEVDFLYAGRLAEPDAVPDEGRPFTDGEDRMWAEWRPVHGADPEVALYPDGLQDLLARHLADSERR